MSKTIIIILALVSFLLTVIFIALFAFLPGPLSILFIALAGLFALSFVVMMAIALFTGKGLPVKISESGITIAIRDKEGKSARFEKTQTLTPAGADLVDIRDRNAFTKGSINDFEVEPGEIKERMTIGKYYIFKVVFDPPLKKGKTVTRRIAYNMTNAFLDDEVDVFIVGDYPTKLMKFRINFPDDRRPEGVRAFVKPKDQPRERFDLDVPDGSEYILWEIEDYTPGTQYHLEWFW
ncbi:MAG: hypothetical protein GY771_06375 [bacterium]|nr:hypothetical protein [bacterium]